MSEESKTEMGPNPAPLTNILGWLMVSIFLLATSTIIIAFFVGDDPMQYQFWRGFAPLFIPPVLATLIFRLGRPVHKIMLNLFVTATLILTLYFAAAEGFTPASRKIVYGALIGIFLGNWAARQINASRQKS